MRDYLYISEALKCCRGDRESNRDFGLANSGVCSNPLNAIREWAYSRVLIHNRDKAVKSRVLFLRRVWIVSIIVAAVLGMTASVSLLTYNGSEPVNIFYFLLFSIILPIFGLILTLISILELKFSGESVAIDFMPPYWIMSLFKKEKQSFHIPSVLIKSYTIYITQIVSLVFYIFMFTGLIAVIAGKDMAFGWSSTLSLNPAQLHAVFEGIAFVWRDIVPSAVPSVSLIEHSHYFRVGIWRPANVEEFGEWWRFLAMTIIIYAIFPRLLLLPLTYLVHKKIEKEAVLSMDGASDIIYEICEPIVESRAESREEVLSYDINKSFSERVAERGYDTVVGWSIPESEIVNILSIKGINAKNIYELGADRDIDDDIETIKGIKKRKVSLFVKGWEPPTMDLIDIVEILSKKGVKIDIIPVGFADDDYRCDKSDFEIWRGKIEYMNIKNAEVVKL